jgi:CheY-like chemotaxis protein
MVCRSPLPAAFDCPQGGYTVELLTVKRKLYLRGTMSSGTGSDKALILVVEDEQLMREFFCEFLRISGHEVIEAVDVAGACDVIDCIPVDVILTDVRLQAGGETGLELLAHVRRLAPHIPVILITGMPNLKDAMNCMKSGAVDYLTKPVQPDALQKAIAKALLPSQSQIHERSIPLCTGASVGGYELTRQLGEGGAAVVFEANRDGEERVALKVATPSHDRAVNQRALHRFFREIRILQKLSHPSITAIKDYGYDHRRDIWYIALEFVEGRSMRLYSGGLFDISLDEKLSLIRQIAEALHAAHRCEVYHRDIKPDNVLVVDHKVIKLVDFGIASVADSTLTKTESRLGTPAYTAPEMFHGAPIDARSDVFALGVVAYELIVGDLPFAGESYAECRDSILNDKPIDPSTANADLPPALCAMLLKMLARDPQDRYPDMGGVLTALSEVTGSD